MNPGRYFMPNAPINPAWVINPMANNHFMMPRSSGIIERALNGIKSFDWKGLLSGANKTLNTVNQTIPLIRQAKPIISNVRNVFRLARAFGRETKVSAANLPEKTFNLKKEVVNDNLPNFFV